MADDAVEEGLRAFCQAWNSGGISPALRMASMLRHKTVNCVVRHEAGETSYVLTLTPERVDLRPGREESAHATLAMSEADWLGVLSGRFSVWGVQLAGRQYSPLHEGALTRQLGLMLQGHALRKRR